jgi:hypothetical protein
MWTPANPQQQQQQQQQQQPIAAYYALLACTQLHHGACTCKNQLESASQQHHSSTTNRGLGAVAACLLPSQLTAQRRKARHQESNPATQYYLMHFAMATCNHW